MDKAGSYAYFIQEVRRDVKIYLILPFVLLLVLSNARFASCQDSKRQKEIKIAIELDKEKQIQIEVDKGHQPWRLEPVATAHAALAIHANINLDSDRCKLLSETDREAIVTCKAAKSYTVRLKRLMQAKGIWSAIEIQIE